MEYKYPSGETIRLHDKVRTGRDGLTGVVVGIIDSREYDPSVAAGKWHEEYAGMLVNTEEGGLVLYSEPDHIAEFVKL
jgi:hypothetical protein